MVSILVDDPIDIPGTLSDVAVDSIGKRIGILRLDGAVHVWDIGGTTPQLTRCTKELDEGAPTSSIAWAPCEYPEVYALGGYDCCVTIWDCSQFGGQTGGSSVPVLLYKDDTTHSSYIMDLKFVKLNGQLVLSVASADGFVSLHTLQQNTGTWTVLSFRAHVAGVSCLDWTNTNDAHTMLATGGNEGLVCVWSQATHSGDWIKIATLGDFNAFASTVTDVAWRPIQGTTSPTTTPIIVACSDDGSIVFWTHSEHNEWMRLQKIKVGSPCTQLSWSITGVILAVAVEGGTSSSTKKPTSELDTNAEEAQDDFSGLRYQEQKSTVFILREQNALSSTVNSGEWSIVSAIDAALEQKKEMTLRNSAMNMLQ